MRLRPAFFYAAALACWFSVAGTAQEAGSTPGIPLDPADVSDAAAGISQRAARLQSIFDEVHPTEWVAKGAPEVYVSQWKSLVAQNLAVQTEMTSIGQRAEADARQLSPQATVDETLRALFRLHRFDSDLASMLGPIRRYQDSALGDRIEGVAAGVQAGLEKLQQYALELTESREKQLGIMDKEAQRCRSALASQPVSRPVSQSPAPRKSTTPNSK